MTYFIYQIADFYNAINYRFMSWHFAQKHDFNFDHYAGVYTGQVTGSDVYQILEDLFVQFNINRPADFKGHSLSVSDIVTLSDGPFEGRRYFYCDDFGFTEITDYFKEEAAKKEAEEKQHSLKTRAEVVRAMDLLARCINNEDDFMPWLMCGVADGDINEDTTDEDLESYCEDDTFAEIMGEFLKVMGYAKKDGLYCDGIVSRD